MWEFCFIGFAILVGGACYYCPYQCMKLAARGRQYAQRLMQPSASGQRWEGSETGDTNLSVVYRNGDGCIPDWDVCFRVLTTAEGDNAYVPRDACSLPSRKTLPFFQTVVCFNGGKVCDVSSTMSMFAYEGNDIGGLDFWRWFLLRFTDGEVAGNVTSVRVLDALTFKERDLDLSTPLRL